MKTQKIDIFESVWQRLPGVHPTIESDSLVCIPPWSQAPRCASYHSQALRSQGSAVHITLRSQNAHSGVKIKILVSHWLLLKGQSGQILLRVNTSIIEEKIWRKIVWFAKLNTFDSPVWCTLRSQNFWTLWWNISLKLKPNSKIYQGPRWVWIMKKYGGQKSWDTLPLKQKTDMDQRKIPDQSKSGFKTLDLIMGLCRKYINPLVPNVD